MPEEKSESPCAGREEEGNLRQLDQWILRQRPPRHAVDPRTPYAFLLEQENFGPGRVVDVATIFLTNRECPWRCVFCDLWKNTLTGTVPVGAIPAQIDHALSRLAPARLIKLYNSGSFFDPRAIPVEDHPAIAARVAGFERVIVECHPSLVGERVLRFRDLLDHGRMLHRERAGRRPEGCPPRLEVAMGLETAHASVLARLNKRMTLDDFQRAAVFLRTRDIATRAFVLVKPPFLTSEQEALDWAVRSAEFAFNCGAEVVSLIPTRFGNGALEALARQGSFSPPRLSTLEAALAGGLAIGKGRVFADLWDLERFSGCAACFTARRERLGTMNLTQTIPPAVRCSRCHAR